MKTKLTTIITFISIVSLAFAGAALANPNATGPEPNGAVQAGQGVLQFKSLESELTVVYEGRGYNLHKNSTLDLPVNPGVHNFDFFCGLSKQFVGGIVVVAGKTTTITLEPNRCAQPIVEGPSAPSGSGGPTAEQAYAAGYEAGYALGSACIGEVSPPLYSSDPGLQAAFEEGFENGWNDGLEDGECFDA